MKPRGPYHADYCAVVDANGRTVAACINETIATEIARLLTKSEEPKEKNP